MAVDYEISQDAIYHSSVDVRAQFIVKTYVHLFISILAFTGIEVFLFKSGMALPIAKAMLGTSWMLVLGAFMVVGWIATHVAHNARSLAVQYAGLATYIIAEAIIFVPLLYLAQYVAKGNVIQSAALVTLAGFSGLTFIAFLTRKDFSFLGPILMWVGFGALLLIVAGAIFGFNLGMAFSVGMVVLAGGAILYDTSNIIHHYSEDQYVGAALELFASVALMFWYVLRIFLAARD